LRFDWPSRDPPIREEIASQRKAARPFAITLAGDDQLAAQCKGTVFIYAFLNSGITYSPAFSQHCLVRQEGISFENRPVGLFLRIPESWKVKIRAGLELDVDRELSLGVFAPLVDAVGPAEKVTSYEISPIPRDMYRAYSSAFAILGNDIVVLKKLVAPSLRMISTIGDDSCLTVISKLVSRYVRFIV
jgi:hypothetical protein